MILAPDKRFLFIHVPKAAGTSINSALSMHDAFFPVRTGDVAARKQHAEKIGLPSATALLGEHASAKHFITALGAEAYGGYYSTAFVRNPWDVAVSWFHYRQINPAVAGHAEAAASGSFAKYVAKHLAGPDGARLVGLQHPFVVDDGGALAVSFMGRYESLEQDFAKVVAHLQITTLALDHFNQSYHPAWPGLYTRDTFEIVRALVSHDAALFGYPDDPAAYGIS
ncbi:MAG: sulfotransferase family 2 domain-containing protein [Rhodospirillaceae bacterium]|nr:sulfotransferase family 2 domain-containing protein [Rhodospirillaceae bacterium]